jgi:sialate O-acetylesterase
MIRYEQAVAKWEADGSKGARPGIPAGPGHPHAPSTLWNGMIAPIVPYAIAGAIWYQGETNGSKERAPVYHRLFSTHDHRLAARVGPGRLPVPLRSARQFRQGRRE